MVARKGSLCRAGKVPPVENPSLTHDVCSREGRGQKKKESLETHGERHGMDLFGG